MRHIDGHSHKVPSRRCQRRRHHLAIVPLAEIIDHKSLSALTPKDRQQIERLRRLLVRLQEVQEGA
jgi:hypothetical protein